MSNRHSTSIRLPKPMQAWLKARADEHMNSVTHELISLLQPAMQAEPLEIFIHECASPTGTFFTASVGKYGTDFYEGEDRDAAFKAARAKAKELELSPKAIRLASENFNQ